MSFTNDEIGELWLLLFLDPSKLTNYELDRLLEHEEGLRNRIQHLWRTFPESLEAMRRYRARKRELDKRSTDELQALSERITQERVRAYDVVDEDDIPDSAFEAPPIDSDEHIVYELLEERKAAGVTTAAS